MDQVGVIARPKGPLASACGSKEGSESMNSCHPELDDARDKMTARARRLSRLSMLANFPLIPDSRS